MVMELCARDRHLEMLRQLRACATWSLRLSHGDWRCLKPRLVRLGSLQLELQKF